MKRIVVLLAFLLSALMGWGQSIQFDPIETGPYGRGSSISVLFKPYGVFPTDNTFELYLSDASGNFNGGEIKIGEYQSFYTTFINGVIPNTVSASPNYKVLIKAKNAAGTVTQLVSNYSLNIVTDVGTSGNFISIDGLGNPVAEKWLWVVCNGSTTSIDISNETVKPITGTFKNEFDTTTAFSNDPLRSFAINAGGTTTITPIKSVHYRILNKITESGSGVISTQSWYLVNNKTVGPFSAVLNTVCYSPGSPGMFQFKVDIDRTIINSQSAYYNFPGYLYEASWDDGNISQFTIQAIDSNGGIISHSYSITSCGRSVQTNGNTFYNSIGPTLKVAIFNPPCNTTVNAITPVQVFQKPAISFTGPLTGCANTATTFTNTSNLGTQGTTDVNGCTTPNITFEWWVDGVKVSSTSSTSPFTISSLSVGSHTITLKPIYNSNQIPCAPTSYSQPICIQPQLAPTFKFDDGGTLKDSIVSCAPKTFGISNTTPSTNCGPTTFSWQVALETTPSTTINPGSTYSVSPDLSSQNPSFTFNPGSASNRYLVTLTASNACGSSPLSKKVVMLGVTGVSLPGSKNYCGTKTINFATDVNHKPSYSSSGNANEQYNWIITGGTYSFVAGTSATSQYPQVQFNDNTTYTITLQFTNSCGAQTTSQQISFYQPVIVDIASDRNPTICNTNTSFSLNSTISGAANTFVWSANGNGTFNPVSNLTTTYTYGSNDKTLVNGLQLTLIVTPTAPNVCPVVRDSIKVTFTPINNITSALTKTICSGNNLNQTLTSAVNGSTFNWTSLVTSGSATGNTSTGSGAIDDVLINSSTSAVALVKYTITPVKDGCNGNPSDFTATVNPIPTLAQPASQTICAGTMVAATNFSGTGTSYEWTNNAIAIGLAASGSGNISSFIATNTSTTATTATIVTIPKLINSSVTCSGSSQSFTITVNPTPIIPNQTPIICSNSSFTVAPVHNGTTIIVPANTTYTWSTPVSSPAGAITGGSAQTTGQTSISQTLTNTTNSSATLTYTVTPAAGTCTGTSFTVTVTVNPQPGISDQMATICSGTAFTATPTNAPANTSYTWAAPVSNPAGAITGGTAQNTGNTISQTLTNTTNLPAILTYVITPSSGSCGNGSFTVTITVNPKPVIATQNAAICSDSSFTITPANNLSVLIVPVNTTYTWNTPSGTGFSGGAAGTSQSSVNGSLVNTTNTVQTATYTVTPTSGAGGSCVGSNFTITVNVNPKPVIGNQITTSCSDASFTYTPANGGAMIVPSGTTYSWSMPAVTGGMTGGAAGTGQSSVTGILTNTTNTAQTATYTVTPLQVAASNCPGNNFDLTITVNPKPAIPAQTTTVCSGVNFSITPANGTPSAATIVPAGTTYSWPAPTLPTGVTGLAAGTNQTSVSGTLVNTTNIPQTVTYYITPTAGTCDGTSFTATVTVNPAPSIANQTATICSGTAFSIPLTNGLPTAATIIPASTTYSWSTPNVTGGMTDGSAGTNETSIGGTLINTTNASQTATCTIIPVSGVAGSCAGNNFTVIITVNPVPNISSTDSTGPTTCASSTGTISLHGLAPNVTYNVTYTLAGVPITRSFTADGTGTVAITGLTAGSYTAISVSVNNCVSNTITGPIILSDPTPPAIPTINTISPICSGNTLALNSSSTTANVTYAWTGPNSFNSNLQNPTIPNATTAATGAYSVTATLNGCTSATATTTAIVDSTPAKPGITSNSPQCYGSTVNLTSTTTFNGALTYLWTNPNGATSNTQNLIISNADETASGNYTLTITANTGNCAAPPASTTVRVTPLLTQAVINGPDSVVICGFAPPANATHSLTANLDASRSFETGAWSIISQPTGGTGTFGDATLPTTTFTYTKSGFYKLQWAITNDINCPSTKDTVIFSVIDKPAITQNLSASSTNVCAGNPVTIQVPGSAVTGQIRYWQFKRPYTANTWQDTLVTNPSVTFNNVTDTFLVRLVVIAIDQVHCSSDTAIQQIQINVAPPSSPGTSAGIDTVCQGANTGSITLTGNIGTPVSWQASTDGISFTNIPASAGQNYTYTNLTTTTWFRAAVKSGTCDTVFSNATKITVFPPVTIANAGPDAALCGDTTYQLNGNTPTALETGVWSFATGSPTAIINNQTSATTTIGSMVPNTVYQLVWTLSNGICPATQDLIVVRNYLPLTNTIDTSTVTVCNSVPVSVVGNTPIGGNPPYLYQWQLLKGNTWVNIQGATNSNFSFIADTTITIRRLVTATPCANTSLEKTIYVQPPLGNNTIAGNTATCINASPGILTGSLPTGGDGNYIYQWQILQGTTWTDLAGATQKDYTIPVLTITTQYRRLVTSALCSGNQGMYSAIFIVTVHPDAKAQWTITKDTACAPFNINNTIVAPASLPLQNGSYNWYADDVFYGTSATTNPGYILTNPADSITIKMVAISLYGCKNDSLEHQFFTIPPVLTAFNRSDSVGCGPLTVSFTNTTPYLGFFTYHWNFGNGITSNATQPGSIVFASNPTFGDTTYSVTLTATSVCESVSKTKPVTVKSRPKSIFTPDKTIGCSPLAVNFTNVSKGIGVTYLWDFGDGSAILTTATPQTVSHSFSTSIQDTFTVKLVAINQCGNDTSSYKIVVSPNQVHLDFAVNGNEKQGCKQHTVHFINATSGATNFEWNFGDGNTLSTTKNIDTVIHTYLQAGVFTVILFATNGCSDTTTTETIQVFNPPSANFNASPLTACLGDTIHFFDQSDTITSLLWNFRDTYTSSLTNPVHAYTVAGVYNVQLKAFRQYNSGLSCVDSINKAVTVVSKLPGVFTVTDSISNCVPFTTTFSNQSIPSALTVWHWNANTTDTGDVVTHTFTQVGTYQVTMDAVSAGGCIYEAGKQIIVRGSSGTWQYDHGNICGTTPVRFAATVTGTDSIRWNFGDGNTITTTSPVVYHSYTQPGQYVPSATLIASLANGCTVVLPGIDTIKVDFIKAGYKYVKLADCDSTILTFTDTTRHYTNIASWQWQFGDGTTNTIPNPKHTYTATNTWTIQLIATAVSGCSDTTIANLFIKVNNTPVNNIIAVTQGCEEQAVSYTAQVISADSVTLNNWKFSNGVNINGTLATNIYAATGTYSATLVSGTLYGCTDTAIKSITINPTPSVTASVDQLICKGQFLQLNATSTAGITWSPLNGTLSCTTCSNPVATPLTTTGYVATATNNFGCSNRDTVTITVAQPIHIVASPNDTICTGSSAQLSVTGATTYAWTPSATLTQPNTATPVAIPTLTTQYQVIGFDNHNCFQDTAKVIVAVGQYPTIDLGADRVVATGTQLPLTYTFTNGPLTTWVWTPPGNLNCSNCATPIASIKKDVCYTVAAANQYKCATSDTICIKVFCEDTQVFIPNVFTPDNDGKNDILMVRGRGIKTIKSFRIFNRWGQVVFERGNISPNDPSQGWDGRINGIPAPPDIYIYTCEVVCENDITFTYKGNVGIIK